MGRKRQPASIVYLVRLLGLSLIVPLDRLWGEHLPGLAALYVVIVCLSVQREPAWAVLSWGALTGGAHWLARWGGSADAIPSVGVIVAAAAVAGLSLQRWLRRQQANELLLTQRLAAAEQLAATGNLAAVAAHEIRAPLTSVKGFLQMLQRRLQGSEDGKWVELIRGDIDRVERLVREFLILGSPRPPRPTLVPVRPLIEESIRAAVLPDASNGALELRVDCASDLAWLCDREHLRQVLVNLIRNAAEASNGAGVIHIAATTSAAPPVQPELPGQSAASVLTLTVTDNGSGIAPELLTQVMEPFFTTKRNGTGLGLAICQELIGNHGGQLDVTSEVGAGTSVTITLPPGKAGTQLLLTAEKRRLPKVSLLARLARKPRRRQQPPPAQVPRAQVGRP